MKNIFIYLLLILIPFSSLANGMQQYLNEDRLPCEIFVKDNKGGTLRLSMSQSNNADDAYTLFSDFAAASLNDGSYMGPYGNKSALTFNNPTWRPWPQLEGFVNLHPTPRLDILGISHFHVMMGIADGYANSILTQAFSTEVLIFLLLLKL